MNRLKQIKALQKLWLTCRWAIALYMMRLFSHSMHFRASSAIDTISFITLGKSGHLYVFVTLSLRRVAYLCGHETRVIWIITGQILTFLDNMQVFKSLHHHLSDDHLVFFVLVKSQEKREVNNVSSSSNACHKGFTQKMTNPSKSDLKTSLLSMTTSFASAMSIYQVIRH